MGTAAKSVAAVDFAALSAEAQGILADLRAMIGSDDAAALPRNLSDTLAAASAVLALTVDRVSRGPKAAPARWAWACGRAATRP